MANKVDITNNIFQMYPDVLYVRVDVLAWIVVPSRQTDQQKKGSAATSHILLLMCPWSCQIPPAEPPGYNFQYHRNREFKDFN